MNFLNNFVNLLPDIIASLGLFGGFEGAMRFLKHKKTKKYIGITSDVLAIVDNILTDHPEYKGTKAEEIIDTTIQITSDSELSWKDFKEVKRLAISLYDPRQATPKRLVGRKEANEKKVKELLEI